MLNKPQCCGKHRSPEEETWHWILHETAHSNAVISCVSEIQLSCSEVENVIGKLLYLTEGHFLGAKCTELNWSIPWPAVQSKDQALVCSCAADLLPAARWARR